VGEVLSYWLVFGLLIGVIECVVWLLR